MTKKVEKLLVGLVLAAALIAALAMTTEASTYKASLGPCVDEIESGKEYVIESVKFPGKVATPDSREKYKGYIGLETFNPSSPRGSQQVWFFSSEDQRHVKSPWSDYMSEEYFTRPGKFTISNHTASYGSHTLQLITYDKDKGYTAKAPVYNSDGSLSDTQWFTCEKVRKQDGDQIWRITGVSSGSGMAPGGWGEVTIHELIESDPAQG